MTDDFFKDKYFTLIDERFDALEEKVDGLIKEVTYMKAWIAGAGAVAGGVSAFVINILMK